MIVSKRFAERLIARGRGRQVARSYNDRADLTYAVVDNYHDQRVDHVLIGPGDLRDKTRGAFAGPAQ